MAMYSATPPALADLTESSLDADPLHLFQIWFEAAQAAPIHLPEAMAVASVGPDGRPSLRMVLLRGVDARGFVFFTNYDSRKGHELTANPQAALLWHWAILERQVRVEGRVEKVSAAESDVYFQSRPRASRLAAWASPQSQVIAGREMLEQRMAQWHIEFGDGIVPCPPHWGGFRVVPDAYEFWQSRPDRLHDRFRYQRRPDGGWRIDRLAP